MLVRQNFAIKHMKSDYRDDSYTNIDDIEYMFGDIDNYYTPILTSSLFNKGYQRYHFRGDKTRTMSVKSYLDTIAPNLTILIDENKMHEEKVQLDISFNMVHIDNKRGNTHFSSSDNITCVPSSDTSEILNQYYHYYY